MHYSIKHTPLAAAMLLAFNAPLYSPQANAIPGDAVGSEFPVNTTISGAQDQPSIAMDADGDFVVVWRDNGSYGIIAQRYSADGNKDGAEFLVNATTTISSTHGYPSVAMDADGDFVIAWQNWNEDGDQNGIVARSYSANGTAISEFPVNTHTLGSQESPNVAMDADGDFVITWHSYGDQDGDGWGIFAQRFSADGTPDEAGELLVNTYTTGSQRFPSIAMDADGDFVVTWQDSAQDGDGSGIYAQRYNSAGTAISVEFPVNTTITSDQSYPDIAMDADGDFVITWTSNNQDGNLDGIYARRYSADGTPASGEFQVNTATGANQRYPSIAMDADGDFAISWHSFAQEGTGGIVGVYAQRYSADGAAAGGEFLVNTETSDIQSFSDIAMDADGDFAIAWQSYGQDAAGDYGIYAQRYLGAGETVDLNLIVNASNNPAQVNADFIYSLITTNNGTGMAMDVNLNDPLPVNVTYVSDDGTSLGWSCSEVTGTLSCNKPFMTAGEVNTIDVTVSADVISTANDNTVTVNAAQTEIATVADNTNTELTDIVADAIAPVITLVGDATMEVAVGTTFTDPGATASDNIDGVLTANIVTVNNVNTAEVGNYTVTYNVSDAAGNAAITVTRTVNVTDGIAPVITLVGDNPFAVVQNTTFIDPGVTITDNVDTGLTATVTGTLDTTTVGSYVLSYDVSDAAGNAATTVTRTVNVTDGLVPVITLVGDSPMTVEIDSVFSDPGVIISDNVDTGLVVTVTGSVDTSALGSYNLNYSVNDAAGNSATTVTRTVNVVDSTSPVITLLGDSTMTMAVDDVFTDPGSSVIDNVDTNLTVNVTGIVDTSTVGSYTLSYDVSDTAGNVAVTLTRTVNVVDANAPVITLLGDNPMKVTKNTEFSDLGATAVDDVDGDISANITITGVVDITTADTYILSYDVTDSAGNVATTVTRSVEVKAKPGDGGSLGLFSLILALPLWLRRRFKY